MRYTFEESNCPNWSSESGRLSAAPLTSQILGDGVRGVVECVWWGSERMVDVCVLCVGGCGCGGM